MCIFDSEVNTNEKILKVGLQEQLIIISTLILIIVCIKAHVREEMEIGMWQTFATHVRHDSKRTRALYYKS